RACVRAAGDQREQSLRRFQDLVLAALEDVLVGAPERVQYLDLHAAVYRRPAGWSGAAGLAAPAAGPARWARTRVELRLAGGRVGAVACVCRAAVLVLGGGALITAALPGRSVRGELVGGFRRSCFDQGGGDAVAHLVALAGFAVDGVDPVDGDRPVLEHRDAHLRLLSPAGVRGKRARPSWSRAGRWGGLRRPCRLRGAAVRGRRRRRACRRSRRS